MRNLILSLCLLLTACGGEGDRRVTTADALLGQSLPKVELRDLSGEALELSSFIGLDKPLLINIWATWCTPCVKELPSLHELSLQGEFNVVTVSIDAKADVVEDYLDKNEFHYLPVFWDRLGEQTRSQLLAKQLPMTYLVNTNGVVKEIYVGEKEWHTVETIEALKSKLK